MFWIWWKVLATIILWQDVGPCCEQTHVAFEVGLSLDHRQGVYSGWSDVVVSSQLRLCHTCIIDVMAGPLWVESTYIGEFPSQMSCDVELWCFLCCSSAEQIVEETCKLPMVRDAVTLMWRHCNALRMRTGTCRVTLKHGLLYINIISTDADRWKPRQRDNSLSLGDVA